MMRSRCLLKDHDVVLRERGQLGTADVAEARSLDLRAESGLVSSDMLEGPGWGHGFDPLWVAVEIAQEDTPVVGQSVAEGSHEGDGELEVVVYVEDACERGESGAGAVRRGSELESCGLGRTAMYAYIT
eukprot:CAMPEP_0174728190 /NCGR_PEP_ID=MMETSP1094-20130205/51273_1 /TAXON_ID=156173 /ORGANISM="Chrysochromulina brevifilum, Strain UTEX LB 985" /LENGTH=128 /DNA_ID=CAMNT_0015930061 /DNA_START=365 /DNA_END=751 /DNA_ORIENTATION=-